ncbi:MAG: glutamine amidotransferase [Bacteroidota bacterium]
MARVYYIGDWAVMTGPVFAESPFNYAHKGLDIFNYGHWLKDALESSGEHEVVSVPSWDFYKLAPGEWERILADFDVIIFSDVESKCFQLAPSFFDRQKFGKEILTFPDRIRLTVEAIEGGLNAMFMGGWLSFTGEMGKGGWGRTRLREVLPVTCLEYEDIVENTEGFGVEITASAAGLFEGIDLAAIPPILGYNQTLEREGFEVLIKTVPNDDPLLAMGHVGSGSVLAYASDPAPHWGCNFVYWDQYKAFWLRCLELLIGDLK